MSTSPSAGASCWTWWLRRSARRRRRG
ncbi:hypothetical protein HaLaN_27822, partial [Haematococcus lacustris]